MKITVAKSAGFCFGVSGAVKAALETPGERVTLGQLIHNDHVNDKLRSAGVGTIDSLSEYKSGTVIIRSHGVGEAVYRELEERRIPYVDATCPFVKKIHGIIKRSYDAGKKIVVIGGKDHPEVVGHIGWCNGEALVADGEDDLSAIDPEAEYCAVVQTTYSVKKFRSLCEILEKRCKTVEIFNTICYTTTDRQNEAEELSKKCDAVLVIGSASSSNTYKLYEISKKFCPDTFLIDNMADLKSVVAKNYNNLGITAGASTPKELIVEVIKQMSDTQNTNVKEESFEELLKESEKRTNRSFGIKAGRIFHCTVISANSDGIYVDFGGKKDGFVDKTEAELDDVIYNPDNYKPGDKFDAMVVEKSGKKDKNDEVSFSKKAVDKRVKEDKEAEEAIRGGEFQVTVERAVKGGLEARLGGYKIFIPASQIRMGFVTDLEKYVGKTLRLRAIEPKKKVAESAEAEAESAEAISENAENAAVVETAADDAAEKKPIEISKRRSIIASQRVILEEEKARKEDEMWSKLQVGAIVTGKVKRLTDFGAFVSVYGFDCLAHISDLSHYNIAHPSEVLEIGKSYQFVILRASREAGRVSLGYKQLQKKPYEIALEKYPVGSVVTGKVRGVFKYGIFVLIERDVDGLVPVSEIANHYVKDPAELYKEGDEVTAKVIKFSDNKITLSIKALLAKEDEPEVEISDEEYKEAKERRASRNAKKFENAAGTIGSAPRKKSSKRQDEGHEVTSWKSESTGATFGDLFNLMDLAADDEQPAEETAEAPAEEKPKAKRTKKAAQTEESAEVVEEKTEE